MSDENCTCPFHMPHKVYQRAECDHDYRPSETTAAGFFCQKCGQWMPPYGSQITISGSGWGANPESTVWANWR